MNIFNSVSRSFFPKVMTEFALLDGNVVRGYFDYNLDSNDLGYGGISSRSCSFILNDQDLPKDKKAVGLTFVYMTSTYSVKQLILQGNGIAVLVLGEFRKK